MAPATAWSTTSRVADPLRPGVYDRYDVIAADQRGAGGSRPAVRCFATEEEGAAFAAEHPAVPRTEYERAARAAADVEFAQRCRDISGDLLDHVTSVEPARDLDDLRAAQGGC